MNKFIKWIFGGYKLSEVEKYHEIMVTTQDKVVVIYKKFNSFAASVNKHTSLNLIENTRLETISSIIKYRKNLESIGGYKGDRMLLDGCIKNIDTILHTLDNESKKIINGLISMDKKGVVTKDDSKKMESLFIGINKKHDKIFAEVQRVQEIFAKKYGYFQKL